METTTEEKKSPFTFIVILIVICALAFAYFFSQLPFHIQNDAQPFSGDISKSCFVEHFSEGSIGKTYFFSESERAELDRMVKTLAEKMQINIIVYASQDIYTDYDIERLCDDSYDSTFGVDTDGVFFYIDLSGKNPAYDYISTSGRVILPLQKKIESIFSNIYTYFPSSQDVFTNGLAPYKENIKRGIQEFFYLLEHYYQDYYSSRSKMYYYHSKRTGKYVFYSNYTFYVTSSRPPLHKFILLLIGEALGAIGGIAFYSSVKRKYRFIEKTDTSVYLGEGSVQFKEQSDTFLREYTSRQAINTSSGMSGGGRVGGGGGGTHGGGGAHR